MNKKNVVQAGARKRAVGQMKTIVQRRLLSPARRVLSQVSRAQAARRVAAEAQKAEAREQVKTAIQAAVAAAAAHGVNILTPKGKVDRKAARRAAEAAAVEAAAKLGFEIRDAKGGINLRKARQAAEAGAASAAAEMGFNIRNAAGKINRREARKAAQAAEDARAGKPVSEAVVLAESRRDALLAAEFKAAERRGASAEQPGDEINRKDALTNAEIAALIREELTKLFS
jgi:hypothetical protein